MRVVIPEVTIVTVSAATMPGTEAGGWFAGVHGAWNRSARQSYETHMRYMTTCDEIDTIDI